jgi:hypothetical protein
LPVNSPATRLNLDLRGVIGAGAAMVIGLFVAML